MTALGVTPLLAQYDRARAVQPGAARQALLQGLAGAPEALWLDCARALLLRADPATAEAVLREAGRSFPDSPEVAIARAGLALDARRYDEAEDLLDSLLSARPGYTGAAFLRFRVLQAQGRLQAAAVTLTRWFEQAPQDIDTTIQAIEWLDGIQRPAEALQLCEGAIGRGVADPRLHAYAGMLCLQLGHFPRVREHYQWVLGHSNRAAEWNIPAGLVSLQRYGHASHPDFALLQATLAREDLSDAARASALFAQAKAFDDIGTYAQAADCLRRANALARTGARWSRKQWRRMIEAKRASAPLGFARQPGMEWAPLFIVGVPRSGTTLLAERLAHHPHIRNRGELGGIAALARQTEQVPRHHPAGFEAAAQDYARQLRQDDAPARWFIDKQPLNLLHLDLMLTLWPTARVLYCERNARDTALSLWSQSFHDPTHAYACDLDDIAAVIHGCRQLMRHWQQRYGASIRTVRYEALTQDPEACLAEVHGWLDLPPLGDAAAAPETVIRTASHWQARQPVYRHAVARWRHYAPFLPELLRIPDL